MPLAHFTHFGNKCLSTDGINPSSIFNFLLKVLRDSLAPSFMFIDLPQVLWFRICSILIFFLRFMKEISQFISEKQIWWLVLISFRLKWQVDYWDIRERRKRTIMGKWYSVWPSSSMPYSYKQPNSVDFQGFFFQWDTTW